MTLYEELAAEARPRFERFFRNVRCFENQFCWEDLNARCYDVFYASNDPGRPISALRARRIVPGLEQMCQKCRDYFIPKRNESIPKYDVVLGEQMEEELMKFLQRKLGTTVCRGDRENLSYPDCRVLRKDGSTAAYFELKYHAAPFVLAWRFTKRECYEGSATLDYEKVQKQLALIDAEITVPVYYIHWIDYPCLKGIFYEEAQAVKARMSRRHVEFQRKSRVGDNQKSEAARYFTKIYSYLLDLGSFEELVEELRSLL